MKTFGGLKIFFNVMSKRIYDHLLWAKYCSFAKFWNWHFIF